MNNEEINKYLTEQLGECWHEWHTPRIKGFHESQIVPECKHCGKSNYFSGLLAECTNPDFFTWTDFGKLWEWATKQEWWCDFTKTFTIDGVSTPFIPKGLINPTNFANAIYKYLKELS